MDGESEDKDTDDPCDCNYESYFLLVKLDVFEVASILEVDRGVFVHTLSRFFLC